MSGLVELLPLFLTAAQTGVQIASMAGAFGGGSKSSGGGSYTAMLQEQQKADKEAAVAEEKKRKAFLATLAGGRGGTVLTSGKGVMGGDVVQGGLKAKLGA